MDPRRKQLIGAIALIALAAWGIRAFLNRPKTSEEAQIRGVLAALEAAVEAKHVGDFCDLVTEDYSDNRHKNKSTLRNSLRGIFGFRLKGRRMEVSITRQDIALGDARDTATVALEFAAWEVNQAAPSTDIVPVNARKFAFDLELVRAGNDWLIKRATERPRK